MKDEAGHRSEPDGPRRTRVWLLGLLATALLVWIITEEGLPAEGDPDRSVGPAGVSVCLFDSPGVPTVVRDPTRAIRP